MDKKLAIFIGVLSIIVIGIVAYALLGNQGRGNDPRSSFRGDFGRPSGTMSNNLSISDEDKASTVQFFDSSPSLEDAESYCAQNRMNCFYYCREVNQEHQVCSKMMPSNRSSPPSDGFGGRE